MFRRIWEAVEAKAREVRMAETERRREKRRSRKEIGGERRKEKEKTTKRKEDRSKESNRRIGDLRQGGRSSKVRRKSKKAGIRKVLQVNPCFWQESQ